MESGKRSRVYRGLFLFGRLGSREPQKTDKKKVPRFFMPISQGEGTNNLSNKYI
jgi:hypothetical protein